MKTKLLRMFRKRFEVIRFGSNSYALLDHKLEKVFYTLPGTLKPMRTQKDAINVGICSILSFIEISALARARQKRIYRSYLIKK